MRRKFMRELKAYNLPSSPGTDVSLAAVTEADLAPLPETVRRYLRFMRVVGKPRDWSFRTRFNGLFRRSRTDPWMKCEVWQYNSRPGVARIFYIQIRFFGIIPVLGRDIYADGNGRMLIRLLDLFTVGDGTGEEYNIGELVTYLNDGVLIAPSMLLVPGVHWVEADADSFDVSISDHGRTVTARVFVDERGAPVNFETTDRFFADQKDATKTTRCRWMTPVEGWHEVGGRMFPTRGQAIWMMPDGELPYADFTFDPGSLVFNVPPAG
ncbi:MAG: DUF6544 family protein [Myxococcota bacterium]